jgi:glycosyltransferase involved in cell wall biosynthesis
VYDLVIVSRPYVAAPLLADAVSAFPDAVLIYDSVDLHFLRAARRRDLLGLAPDADSEQAELTEIQCVRESHVTATVSEVEAAIVRARVPGAKTVVLPTVHEPDTVPGLPFERRSDLLFIGNFIHDPNVDAVLHFTHEILPLIARELDARLWLLGQDPPPEVRALQSPSVVVTGFVPRVDDYFRQARVSVAPLRYGAGMKGKNGQAMAFGLPLVTTSVGAEGMDIVDERHALVSDGPEDFAQAVIRLYRDQALWERLSHKSQELARREWSPDAMRRRLERLLAGVGADAPLAARSGT